MEREIGYPAVGDVTLMMLMQMKGKREFPPDVPTSGDVLSHLSESDSEILRFSLQCVLPTYYTWTPKLSGADKFTLGLAQIAA